MKSRLLLKVQVAAVAAALCLYAGLHLYKSHRYTSAYADTHLGDSLEMVKHRFGAPPNVEWPGSDYFMGFTMFPCAPPCNERLWWDYPNGVFRLQAYYLEFDVNRHLINKTYYEHLDEGYLQWVERWKEASKRGEEAGLDWSSTDAERFRAAKFVALVRLLEPPQVDPRDSSWGPLSKFLVLRSWKGPFSAGATVTAATAAMCYGPRCTDFLFPKKVGQFAVISSLQDLQPIFPISGYGVDEAHIEGATAKVDALAAQTAT
jgi:hypothetical protein